MERHFPGYVLGQVLSKLFYVTTETSQFSQLCFNCYSQSPSWFDPRTKNNDDPLDRPLYILTSNH